MIDWMNPHLESFTDDESAFHNSTPSKMLCYLRIAYGTWGENPRAGDFRDHAILKLYEGKVVPVLREFGADQEEVAYTLGAGRWTTFWRVTLPSVRWGLAYGVTLTVARALGEFGALLVVSGNILGRTQTATLYIHDGIESFNTEGAYAASVLLAGVSFVLLVGREAVRKRVEAHERPE